MGHHTMGAIALSTAAAGLAFVSFAQPQQDTPAPQEAAAAEARPAVPEGDATVDAAISGEELMGHVKALSSDALLGRPMGSVESMVAAEYCVERFKAMGFEPGAEDGTFLQRIRFGRAVYKEIPELRVSTTDGEEATLLNGEFFTFQSASLPMPTEVLKVLIVETEEDLPKEADPMVALCLTTSAGKAGRWLRAAGFPRGSGFGLVLVARSGAAGEASKPRDTTMMQLGSDRGGVQASLRGEWGERAKAGELASVQFLPQAELEFRDDANVVAVLPGSDDGGKSEEFVLLTAHRDHIGVRRGPSSGAADEDLINNGADDDASGCAVVMEIAESMAQGPRPARSVMAILVTGEERGMVGSRHWVENPTVPLEAVICALNFEMLGRPDELVGGAGKLWLTGDDRSNLGPHLREAELPVATDPRPEGNFFMRSDNVSFARKGIVSQTLSSFGGHGDYHKVTDEWDTLDYGHMETAAAGCLQAVRILAKGDWTPAWNEGEPKL